MDPVTMYSLVTLGSSLLGSLFGSKPKAPQVDPRYNQVIDALMQRSQEGLSKGAESAFMSRGREGIGQSMSMAQNQISRNLARTGGSQGSLANTYALSLAKEAGHQQSGLAKDVTMMDEQAKSQAFGDLVSALGGKSYADTNRFYGEKSMMPDWGTPMGMALYSLLLGGK